MIPRFIIFTNRDKNEKIKCLKPAWMLDLRAVIFMGHIIWDDCIIRKSKTSWEKIKA